MTAPHRGPVVTVLVAASAVIAGMGGAALSSGAEDPLPLEGILAPEAVAHADDMGALAPRHRDDTGAPLPERPLEPTPVAPARPAEPASTMRSSARKPRPYPPDEPPRRATPPRLREPVTVRVPDLGIDSPVIRTWMDAGRGVIVPEDVLVTAWYDGSRRLGARQGSTVIVGHRDSATQGSGALYAIEELPLGSRVSVTARDGTVHDFTVESVEFIDKANLPAEAPRVFTREGPYRLVLITCGGAFDSAAGSYLSNVVVTAVPTPGMATQP